MMQKKSPHRGGGQSEPIFQVSNIMRGDINDFVKTMGEKTERLLP